MPLLSLALACAAFVLSAGSAQALVEKTFVSAKGSGSACSLTAPCADLQLAHDETAPLGEINCLDNGPFFGGLTQISKSITIDCGDVAVTSFNGFAINAPGIVVTIRNLSLNNLGIDFTDGAALIVEKCFIANITGGMIGIRFRPSSSGSQLVVSDTTLVNNGNGSTGGGIVIKPQSGGSAQVTLSRVTATRNVFGIAVDGTGSTGGINMTITDSVTSSNRQDGILAVTPSGGAPIGVYVKNTRSSNNAIGIRSIGPNVTVRVDGSSVIGNSTGLSFSGGGALLSFGNNAVQANGSNGVFSGSAPLQ